jgi:hypothetical protein
MHPERLKFAVRSECAGVLGQPHHGHPVEPSNQPRGDRDRPAGGVRQPDEPRDGALVGARSAPHARRTDRRLLRPVCPSRRGSRRAEAGCHALNRGARDARVLQADVSGGEVAALLLAVSPAHQARPPARLLEERSGDLGVGDGRKLCHVR